jgi:hypothetical protein
LVAPGHVSSTPRLVKAADALVEAGYQVHVVSARTFPGADALDADLLRSCGWSHTTVDLLQSGRIRGGLRRAWARRKVGRATIPSVTDAARAHHAGFDRLRRAVGRIDADLYLGHCLAGLPVAAAVAGERGAAYGFDAEDFHDAETTEAMADPIEVKARRRLQSEFLPGCRVLTAASPLIARQYLRDYGVTATTVLNVFPRAAAPASPVDPGPMGTRRRAQLYWFSQTIGPGRGLEKIVAAAARMTTPVEIVLRGFPAPGFSDRLHALAAKAGPPPVIRFVAPGAPSEMSRLAAGADLGLSIEDRHPLNRDICLTNKIFAYLLAGIPQLLSATTAQCALAADLGPAALVSDLDDGEATAKLLDEFLAAPDRREAARTTAWRLAQERYCWDREKAVLLRSVAEAFAARH